jgi:hypothetical protein
MKLQVRSEITAMNDEWRELDSIYRLETKKRRSRFSEEELRIRYLLFLFLFN